MGIVPGWFEQAKHTDAVIHRICEWFDSLNMEPDPWEVARLLHQHKVNVERNALEKARNQTSPRLIAPGKHDVCVLFGKAATRALEEVRCEIYRLEEDEGMEREEAVEAIRKNDRYSGELSSLEESSLCRHTYETTEAVEAYLQGCADDTGWEDYEPIDQADAALLKDLGIL